MNDDSFVEITPGVYKMKPEEKGLSTVEFQGKTYFRFMDYFYIETENLDDLKPEQVSNLCRARAMYPHLISPVNIEVRQNFKALVEIVRPSKLLEIGAGQDPVLSLDETEQIHYVLSDADTSVVTHHTKAGRECYEFSKNICNVPDLNDLFDMAIAVFVLHFPFHKNQLLELSKRLKPSGIIVANVYRRNSESRDILMNEMLDAGFISLRIPDNVEICRDHEYWIIGKQDSQLKKYAHILEKLVLKQNL